jgi:hypothetical protein
MMAAIVEKAQSVYHRIGEIAESDQVDPVTATGIYAFELVEPGLNNTAQGAIEGLAKMGFQHSPDSTVDPLTETVVYLFAENIEPRLNAACQNVERALVKLGFPDPEKEGSTVDPITLAFQHIVLDLLS